MRAQRPMPPRRRAGTACEILTLPHTIGVSRSQVLRTGDRRAFVVAALLRCFIERRSASNLPPLWRLSRLWQQGADDLDPHASRLAPWMDERIDVHPAPPAV